MTLNLEQLARDEIVYLPLSAIDPDPKQPRLDVDEELADSIKQHGVLQAIQVRPHPSGADDRWMIVDGERRYRGAKKAKADTIPATITLDVEEDGDRIVRQIVRNEGKPLTPSEEAIAYKRIIASKQAAGAKSYGVVQLAKELGLAKSTVSDRLAMTEIPEFWLPLITDGPLQPSHVPLLHKWRKVPEKYQRQALEQMKSDYRWAGGDSFSKAKKGERIYVSVFETLLRTFMAKFIKPVSDVPGYDGPTERGRFESYGDGATYAMDPAKWQPIWRKKLAEKKTAQGKQAATTKAKNEGRTPKWVQAAVDCGATLVEGRQYFAMHDFAYDAQFKGVTPIVQNGEWYFRASHNTSGDRLFDPTVLMQHQDLSKLVIVKTKASAWDGAREKVQWRWQAGTRDDAALGLARSAYLEGERAEWERILASFGTELLDCAAAAGRDALIIGGAAPYLVKAIVDGDPQAMPELLFSYALAASVPGVDAIKPTKPADLLAWLRALDTEQAQSILNAIAITERDNLEPPPAVLEAWQQQKLAEFSKVKPRWGGAPAGSGEDESDDVAEDSDEPLGDDQADSVDDEDLNDALDEDLDDIDARDVADDVDDLTDLHQPAEA
jgi:ParB/RepB/Spo0J family partition protein